MIMVRTCSVRVGVLLLLLLCMYMLDIAANLLSVAKITSSNAKVVFDANGCNIMNNNNECIASAYKQPNSNLYRISVQAMYAGNVSNNNGMIGNITNIGDNVNTRN